MSNHGFPRHTLPLLQQVLLTSRKSYASIGRKVRKHMNNSTAEMCPNDHQLGKKVALLLTPLMKYRIKKMTRRKQCGGGRFKRVSSRHKQNRRLVSRQTEESIRQRCIHAL